MFQVVPFKTLAETAVHSRRSSKVQSHELQVSSVNLKRLCGRSLTEIFLALALGKGVKEFRRSIESETCPDKKRKLKFYVHSIIGQVRFRQGDFGRALVNFVKRAGVLAQQSVGTKWKNSGSLSCIWRFVLLFKAFLMLQLAL